MWWMMVGCTIGDTPPPPTPTVPVTPPVVPTADTGTPAVPTGDTSPAVPICPDGLSQPFMETNLGCVIGRSVDAVEGFLGIPYAEAPIGPLRWSEPVPMAPWIDPRTATEVGPPCPQSNGTLDGVLAPGDGSEDCLTLNVLRPEGTMPGADLPMMVFVHGGGHTDGTGAQAAYLGGSFADPLDDLPALDDVPDLAREAVVVTLNYRLGALGWLAHPDLGDGNQGLHDALLALRWVNDNAVALGGDPDSLLLFGESAGAVSVCSLLAAPDADGLYTSATIHSATCAGVVRGLSTAPEGYEPAYDQGHRLEVALGCDTAADPSACMREASPNEVLAALPARLGVLGDGEGFGPIVDGVLLPQAPQLAFLVGDVPQVPVTFGVNADEGTLFTALTPIVDPGIFDLTLWATALALGWDAAGLIDLYDPAKYGGSVPDAWSAFVGDAIFVCPAREQLDILSAHTETRAYWFSRENVLLPWLGAAHGFELPYVFGTGFKLAADAALADEMRDSWVSMAAESQTWSGGAWPPFGGISPDGGTYVDFGVPSGIVTGPRRAECDWMADQ